MPTSAGAPADRGLRGAGGAFSLVLLRLLGLADKFGAANIRLVLLMFSARVPSQDPNKYVSESFMNRSSLVCLYHYGHTSIAQAYSIRDLVYISR